MNSKERLERFLSDTPIKPVLRTRVNGTEIFIADGFVTPEMYRGLEVKFGIPINVHEHPTGCFATLWYADGKYACPSGIGYFSRLHDIESIAVADQQTARINTIIEQAGSDNRLRRNRLNG